MFYTNYFKGIDLSSIKSSLNTLLSDIDTLVSKNSSAQTAFSDSSWVATAKATLNDGFESNSTLLEGLRNQINTLLGAFPYAEKIVEIQEHMESGELDEHDLYGGASEIERQLYYFNEEMSKLSAVSILSDFITSGVSDSGVFEANQTKLEAAKEAFTSYSDCLINSYSTFNGLESSMSVDSYLYYAFGVLAQTYDSIVTKRDNLESWITNYISNLKSVEDSLPDQDVSVKIESTTIHAQSRTYASAPTLESYGSSGLGSELPRTYEIPASYYGDDSYSQAGSGGGSPYYPGDDSVDPSVADSNYTPTNPGDVSSNYSPDLSSNYSPDLSSNYSPDLSSNHSTSGSSGSASSNSGLSGSITSNYSPSGARSSVSSNYSSSTKRTGSNR